MCATSMATGGGIGDMIGAIRLNIVLFIGLAG